MSENFRRQAVEGCPICGLNARSEGRTLTDLSGVMTGTFVSVTCPCGVNWLRDPVSDEDIALAYDDDYYSFRWPELSLAAKVLGGLRQRLLISRYRACPSRMGGAVADLLPCYPPPGPVGRVLDVGCGSGERMRRLEAAGWECIGIDASQPAVATGTEKGLDIRLAEANDLPFPDESFDAVLMSHSIEHCQDPRRAVREAARVLKPGGSLTVTTPNGSSPVARLFGEMWVNWDAPRHYLVFSSSSLRNLLLEQGFDVTRVRGSSTGWSWAESLHYLGRSRHWRNTDLLVNVVRLPAMAAALCVNFSRYADEVEIVSRKA
jgi:SAM-dependent methyltransferase